MCAIDYYPTHHRHSSCSQVQTAALLSASILSCRITHNSDPLPYNIASHSHHHVYPSIHCHSVYDCSAWLLSILLHKCPIFDVYVDKIRYYTYIGIMDIGSCLIYSRLASMVNNSGHQYQK